MIFERIIGIAACDDKGLIGRDGKLPWHFPEDIKFFQNITENNPMIMGRRTFLSLPHHYLYQRKSFIFSRQKKLFLQNPNCICVSSLSELFSLNAVFKDLFVIGGAEIYDLFLKQNLIVEFILTKIKGEYHGDTFFPLELLNHWPKQKIKEKNDFVIYRYYNPKNNGNI